jgi:hypothetical protein
MEVDFVVGDLDVVLEVKASARVHDADLKGVRTLLGEYRPKHTLIVCMESLSRVTTDGVRILPWREFLSLLWNRDLGL